MTRLTQCKNRIRLQSHMNYFLHKNDGPIDLLSISSQLERISFELMQMRQVDTGKTRLSFYNELVARLKALTINGRALGHEVRSPS